MSTFIIIILAYLYGTEIEENVYSIPAHFVSTCNDSEFAFIDTTTWAIFGDQNSDGLITGTECDWN